MSELKHSNILLFLLGSLWLVGTNHHSVVAEQQIPTVVIYPKQQSSNDRREEYRIKLLEAVLRATEVEFGLFELRYSTLDIPNHRLDIMVSEQKHINIFSTATSKTLEQDLIPIRIPILKGLMGLRLFLIREKSQSQISKINNDKELLKLVIGQGQAWPDVTIFRHNLFTVTTSSRYDNLFRMLVGKRFDIFPRGVNEIFEEHQRFSKLYPSLRIEKTRIIYYPLPVYFFVSKDNPKLADRINVGIRRLIKDGVFDQLFLEYHQSLISQMRIDQRKLTLLENPLLPENIEFLNDDYWLKEIHLIHQTMFQ